MALTRCSAGNEHIKMVTVLCAVACAGGGDGVPSAILFKENWRYLAGLAWALLPRDLRLDCC